MSLIWRSSLLRAQRCYGCPGAPKPGCGSCYGFTNVYQRAAFPHRCGCYPCVQVPLDNRIVFRNDCCKPKHDCDCDDGYKPKKHGKKHGCDCGCGKYDCDCGKHGKGGSGCGCKGGYGHGYGTPYHKSCHGCNE